MKARILIQQKNLIENRVRLTQLLGRMNENSDNSWSASNMLFQMTGYWEILVYITEDNETEVATFQFDCCQ